MNIPTLKIYPTAPPPIVQTPNPIDFPAPISYDFQVVEQVEDGKVVKVSLQVRVNQHDTTGSINIYGNWTDVPRVRVGKDGLILPPT